MLDFESTFLMRICLSSGFTMLCFYVVFKKIIKLEANYNIVVIFAIYQHELGMGVQASPYPEPHSHLPPHPIPLGCPRALSLSALLHASNLYWSSILHMVIYMLQCHSLKSTNPRLLSQSPKIFSLHLCFFCCLVYRILITIFLNYMYMC